MKIIKRLVQFLVVLVVVLALALWLLPAPIIKWAIENPGSQAVGAQVDVDSVAFSWFPISLTIDGLAVTNPRQPMTNAVEFQHINTEVNVQELIAGKVYLEQVLVEGIALDTPRKISGALPGAGAPAEESESGFSLPDLGLPNTTELVDKELALYQQRIHDFNTKLDQRNQSWQDTMAGLPGKDALQDYQTHWDKAQDGNVLNKVKAAKEISSGLKQDIKKLEASRDQIKTEYAQLQQEYKQLSGLSGKSADQIIQQLGLSDSMVANLGSQLLGARMQQWLQMGEGYYQLLAGNGAASSETEEATVAEPKTAPDFLVKLVHLSGPFLQGERTGTIDGEIRNLSDAPALWPEPVTVKINATGDTLGTLDIQGLLAHQQAGAEKDSLKLSIKNSQLQNLVLSDSGSLGMALNKALLNFEAKADIKALSQLNLNLDGVFSKLELALTSDATESWQKTLAQTVSSLDTLTLKGVATGALSDPDLKLSTNLNGILKTALGAEIRQRAAALRGKLTSQLNDGMQQQMQPLQVKLSELGNVSGEVDTLIDEFKSTAKAVR